MTTKKERLHWIQEIGDYRYNPEYQLVMKEAMKSYEKFVNGLPDDYKAVINLRWDGCTKTEIKNITGFSYRKINKISNGIKENLNLPCNKDVKDDLFDLINLPYGNTKLVYSFKYNNE